MSAGDWFRALQVPVLGVGVGPVLVGTNLGALDAGHLDPLAFAFSVASVLAIQIGANLQKGLVESRDMDPPPARPPSMFAFDAGAVLRVGWERRSLERLAIGAFGAGAAFGLAVVALRADPVLLIIGLLGSFFAYSYSGAPLKLSYRGIGEIATFFAFGPLMLWGAYRAQQGGALSQQVFWLGMGFGFLAAMISFARYFPAQAEDERKGKRTPLVLWGPGVGTAVFVVMMLAAAGAFVAPALTLPSHCPFAELPVYGPVDALVVVFLGCGVVPALLLRIRGGAYAGAGIGVLVACHALLSIWNGQTFLSGCV